MKNTKIWKCVPITLKYFYWHELSKYQYCNGGNNNTKVVCAPECLHRENYEDAIPARFVFMYTRQTDLMADEQTYILTV